MASNKQVASSTALFESETFLGSLVEQQPITARPNQTTMQLLLVSKEGCASVADVAHLFDQMCVIIIGFHNGLSLFFLLKLIFGLVC